MIRTAGTANGSYSYFPGQNEIVYWREGTPVDSIKTIGFCPDINGNGQLDLGTNWRADGTRYFSNSMATMPHSMSSGDTIFMIFSGFTEEDVDANGKNFRDVFLTYSINKGVTWSGMINLTQFIGFNIEQIYASISPTSDENIHLVFTQSTSIGAYDATDNPDAGLVNYDIVHLSVPKASIFDNTVGINTIKNEVFTIVNNYPNPFKGTTNIGVQFNQTTNAVVKVINVTGQEVFNQSFEKIPTGLNNLELNLGNLPAGVYFYSIEANGFKTTGKMIAE